VYEPASEGSDGFGRNMTEPDPGGVRLVEGSRG
jgi:hypothetical protein